MFTDVELLLAYTTNGSEEAFRELVERHLALVYSAALRQLNGDAHLAQDVAQSVFADLARKANGLAGRFQAGRGIMAGWLLMSTRFAALKVIRSSQRRQKYERQAMLESGDDNARQWELLRPVLDEMMVQLGDKERDAIVLRFFEQKDLREVGEALGLSEDAARMRINRAMEKLARLLKGKGVALSITALGASISAHGIQAAPAGLAGMVAAASTLAGGGSSVGLAILKIMGMTKIKTAAVGVLIAAGIGTPYLIQQQRSLDRLQRENGNLRVQVAHVDMAQAENEAKAVRDRKGDGRARAEFLELMRLRGEVGLLRKESQELARLRTEKTKGERAVNDALANPKLLPAEAWADVGMDTPDAALQTFFWAARHENSDLVGKLVRWQKDASVPDFIGLDEIVPSLVPGTVQFVKELDGMTVLNTAPQDDGSTKVEVELAAADGKPSTRQKILFVNDEGGWKPVFHVWSPRQGSIQGALGLRDKAEGVAQ
jgi:RNA polymerase sigma factor (sigma-70 family)